MTFLRPKHSAVDAAQILLDGLRDGSIVLETQADTTKEEAIPSRKRRYFHWAYHSAAVIFFGVTTIVPTVFLKTFSPEIFHPEQLASTRQASQQLHRFAAMNDQDFAVSLPAFQSFIETQNKESFSLGLVEPIATKLRKLNPNTPAYWPSVLGFIQAASTSSGSPALPSPVRFTNLHIKGGIAFQNMTVILDGGGLEDTSVVNSAIVFTGNPTLLKNVRFINCRFLFSVSDNPPQQTKHVAEQLLASSDLSNVTVYSSGT